MNEREELQDIIEWMKEQRIIHVHFEAGLSDQEVKDIEQLCNIQFPPA